MLVSVLGARGRIYIGFKNWTVSTGERLNSYVEYGELTLLRRFETRWLGTSLEAVCQYRRTFIYRCTYNSVFIAVLISVSIAVRINGRTYHNVLQCQHRLTYISRTYHSVKYRRTYQNVNIAVRIIVLVASHRCFAVTITVSVSPYASQRHYCCTYISLYLWVSLSPYAYIAVCITLAVPLSPYASQYKYRLRDHSAT